MQKLTLGAKSSVLFFEPSEKELLSGIMPGRSVVSAELNLLKHAGIRSNAPFLSLELFENDSGSILFVNEGECMFPERRVFRFSSCDELLDAAAALSPSAKCGRSELYFYRGAYYLSLAPDYPSGIECLCEFGDEKNDSPSEFAVFLREHGETLSEPCALEKLCRRPRLQESSGR